MGGSKVPLFLRRGNYIGLLQDYILCELNTDAIEGGEEFGHFFTVVPPMHIPFI